jgi:hypothetical protein
LGIGDWGLGIGDWGLGIGPNPQSPIPNYSQTLPKIIINENRIKLLIINIIKNNIAMTIKIFNN